MSKRFTYRTPEKGKKDWHIPLNENFNRIGSQLDLLNWRLKRLNGYIFHHTISKDFPYNTPEKDTPDWHKPLIDNFEKYASYIQDLDTRLSNRDGNDPGTYEYNAPEKGAKDWHIPLNDNFEQIATDLKALDARLSNLESDSPSYAASVDSGNWNDPSIWDTGKVPSAGDNVLIRNLDSVTIAGQTANLDWVRVEGELKFDPTVDTHLKADTVLTTHGSSLEMGTKSKPIQQGVKARITFRDTGPIDEDRDPDRRSRGLLVHDDLSIHGAEKTAWTTLSEAPTAGDTTISLTESPDNWQVGDRIVIPGLVHNENQDEERLIKAVNGSTIELDATLDHDHVPPKSNLDTYVLNLSRNIVLESESTDELRRGHVMIMMTQGTDIRYIQFRDLGRTNKDQYLTNPVRGESELPDGLDPNPAARYPFHYHRTGIDGDIHIAKGLVVDGGPGWGIVNHHAYAEITDSITYDVLGAGFVAEGGNERGSFKRNFALRSEGSGDNIDTRAAGAHGGDPPIDDFGHAGHGYWFQSPLVKAVDNVAAGHRHFAFVHWLRPLLDPGAHDEAECMEITDSRVTTCPNTRMDLIDQERHAPMLEAIERGRFSNNHDAMMRDSQKVPSTFLLLERFEGNTAFGSAGGLDFSRNCFKWKHERFSDFSVIEDFTVYNVGPFVDDSGNSIEPSLPRHRSPGHQGRGGNVGVQFRYTSNVKLKNSRLIGNGQENSVAVPFHDYLWTVVIENCEIENWDWGIGTGEHRLNWIRNNTFRDNNYDVGHTFDNVGPTILEENDLNSVWHTFARMNLKAPEVLETNHYRGVRINGRTAYVEESHPNFVPFPDKDSLSGVNNIERYIDTVDNEENLVGLTNQEMLDQYGICVGGYLMPDDAVDESFIDGRLAPSQPRDPPTAVWLDATNASGGDFEIVSQEDTAGNQALRYSGSSDPKSNPGSIDFSCADGIYELYFRAWTVSWNGDGIYFRIDGGQWYKAEKLKLPVGFKWHSAAENNASPYKIQLSEGNHKLEIACTEEGVMIDEILIASDATVMGAYGQSET